MPKMKLGMALVLSAFALAACKVPGLGDDAAATPADKASASGGAVVVATVNDAQITDRDIAPLMAGGLDRANAIDKTVNRVLAGQLGQKFYKSAVAEAMHTVESEVAANVFANQKGSELLKAVTDAEIQSRYTAIVKDADFTTYQLDVGLFASEDDARTAAQGLINNPRGEDAKKFKALVPGKNPYEPGGYLLRSDIPYNLGVMVAKLKPGEFTPPLMIREGVLVLRLRDAKANPKPELKDLKEGLRRGMADERLGQMLLDARKEAKISIK